MNKLLSMLSALPDPAIIIGRDMSISFQNPASIESMGVSLGLKCHMAIEDDIIPCMDCPTVEAFEDQRYHTALRTCDKKPGDRTRRYVEVSASPVMDDGGTVSECVVIHRDLTDAKENEAQKKDNLSMLSHDLRSPLTIIQSYADLLLDTMQDADADNIEMLSQIKRSTEVSVRLLDDFMTLSKIEAGKLKLSLNDTSLGLMARSHAERFSALAREKAVDLVVEIQENLPRIRVDEQQFGRVIANILANAIKYSEKGCKVWVRVGTHSDRPDELYLEVADEGPGIPIDDVPRVMEKYYRSGNQGKAQGSGLGLAIVKAITELHNGTVEIANRAEGGACVRVVLPTFATP